VLAGGLVLGLGPELELGLGLEVGVGVGLEDAVAGGRAGRRPWPVVGP
jgi:hypothetical protein